MSDLDDVFNEFARSFVGTTTTGRDVAWPKRLDRSALDGSVDSLRAVDDYLAYLAENRDQIDLTAWDTTVLWGGAYVGEVIRHARPGLFHWVDYNDYIPEHPQLQGIIPERTVATCAFLVCTDGSMSMPLNKVARAIEEGPENSVHFFAVCDVRKKVRSRPGAWWKRLWSSRPN